MPKGVGRVEDAQRAWAKREVELLGQRFSVIGEAHVQAAKELESGISAEVAGMTAETRQKLQVKTAEQKARDMRTEARDTYDIEYMAYLDRIADIKAELEMFLLQPARDADPMLVVSLREKTDEALRSLMEHSIRIGNLALGDTCWAEAWHREHWGLIHYYAEARADEEWQDAVEQLILALEILPEGANPLEKFDRLYPEPSLNEIYNARPPVPSSS